MHCRFPRYDLYTERATSEVNTDAARAATGRNADGAAWVRAPELEERLSHSVRDATCAGEKKSLHVTV